MTNVSEQLLLVYETNVRGPFLNLIAGGKGSLVSQKKLSQEKHLRQASDGQVHQDHLPGKRCSKSQRCIEPGLWISVVQELMGD